MGNEWCEFTFSQLIEKGLLEIGDGYRAKISELGGDGPIFLRAGHVTDTHIDFAGVDRFQRDRETAVASKTSRPGDVVVTTKGNSTGRVTFVDGYMPSFVYSPHLSYWRSLDREKIVPGFLRYWSRSYQFRSQLKGFAASTDMAPYLSLIDQRRLQIILPSSAAEQRAIADILGVLDDKIDVNRQMNQTLESMARTIFKSWFVDFDPVRAKAEARDPFLPEALASIFPNRFEHSEVGEIPKGWRVSCIGEIADVVDCLHSKKPEQLPSGKPLLQLWNIRDDAVLDMTDSYWISEPDYQNWVSRIEASPGDCVITNVGRVGAVAQVPRGVKAALGRNMTGVRCRQEYPFPTFLLQALTSDAMREEIETRKDSGTILDALNVRNIPRLRVVLPDAPLLSRFEQLCRPVRFRMETIQQESETLSNLRDTLLPKLISGELRLPDVERFVGGRV